MLSKSKIQQGQILLFLILFLTTPSSAGPICTAITYGLCVGTCAGLGVFAFGTAVVATNGAAAAALALPGPGVWVSCSSMCSQMIGLVLIIPTP